MTTSTVNERTYGNFQAPPRAGLWGQGLVATMLGVVGIGISVLVLVLTSTFLVPLILLGLTAAITLPFVIRVNGDPAAVRLLAAITGSRAAAKKLNTYLSGPLGVVPGGTHRLPGLLTATDAFEFSAGGRRFALLWHTRAHHWTVVIACYPEGQDLVDDDVLDRRVARHGSFLARFATDRDVVGIQQLVELVPDPGGRARDAIVKQIVPSAPEAAQAAMWAAAAKQGTGQTRVGSRTSVTWRTPETIKARPREERPELMATWVAAKLNSICTDLQAAGAGVARPMELLELAEELHLAYDPAAARDIDEQRISHHRTTEWEDAGPAAMIERPGDLLHDSGRSVSWSMVKAPSSDVDRNALLPLLAAEPGVLRKRLCITWRPEPADKAQARVKRSIRASIFKASADKLGDAGDDLDMSAHRSTQRELRKGAALLNFSMHLTITMSAEVDESAVSSTVEAMEASGRQADVALRRCWRHQQVGFTAALGVGVIPAELSVMPRVIRENL